MLFSKGDARTMSGRIERLAELSRRHARVDG
jgi:hypothetical protein